MYFLYDLHYKIPIGLVPMGYVPMNHILCRKISIVFKSYESKVHYILQEI